MSYFVSEEGYLTSQAHAAQSSTVAVSPNSRGVESLASSRTSVTNPTPTVSRAPRLSGGYGSGSGFGAGFHSSANVAMPRSLPAADHNRITVACRVKPQDAGSNGARSVSVGNDARTVAWVGERSDGANARHFTFDYAAGEDVGQEELFEQVCF